MKTEKIAVVGAGLVGSLHALYLAQKGYDVHLFDRRGDIRGVEFVGGRSINLAMSDRGWKALRGAGMEEEIRKIALPMKGRRLHNEDGTIGFQPYGLQGQAIYSVSRGELNKQLIISTDKHENTTLYFHHTARKIDFKTNAILFEKEDGSQENMHFDRIFGTDGAFSAIRSRMQRLPRFNFSQEYLTHGYKELCIPARADGTHQMDPEALHIWPRREFMLIALPNEDGSFTLTLFAPFEGKDGFDNIKSREDVERYFKKYFPDSIALMPDYINDYFENPTSTLITIRCSPWHIEDKICLLGDASHAIVPFYGQGMNSGFEDCTILHELHEELDGDWDKIFSAFSKKRVPEANAISELAMQNYIEMRDKTADPEFLLQKKIERKLMQDHPDAWMALYSQVTFSHIPYDEALAAGRHQDQIMKSVMDRPDIEQVWDSAEVQQAILDKLALEKAN